MTSAYIPFQFEAGQSFTRGIRACIPGDIMFTGKGKVMNRRGMVLRQSNQPKPVYSGSSEIQAFCCNCALVLLE